MEREFVNDESVFAPVRIPLFRRFLLARFVSAFSNRMVGVGIAWQVFDRTNSEFASGLVGLVEIIPVFLLGLPAGHLSDVKDRRSIVMATRSMMAICAAILLWTSTGQKPIEAVFAAVALLAAVRTFQGPAVDNLLPRILEPRLFPRGVAWLTNLWQFSAIVAPVAAGFLIARFDSAWPVFATELVAAPLVVWLYASLPRQKPEPPEEDTTWGSILAGGRFLKENPVLLAAISLDLFAVLFGGAVALLPAFAKKILNVGPVGLGWLTSAQSVGALAMSLVLLRWPNFRRAGAAMLWAVAGFGAATVVFGLSRSFALSFAMLFAMGALDNISVVVRSTLLLLQVPDRMRGRVSAFNDIFVGASNELGGFESGLLARFIGPVRSVVVGGLLTLGVVGFTTLVSRPLRTLGRLAPADLVDKPDAGSQPGA
jgi:MFS family permease